MRRLWSVFGLVLIASFAVLSWVGVQIYQEMNIGLFAMCCLSLLPVGLRQTWASVEHGYWYARSSEFMQTDLVQTLRWMRVPGDTIFFLGAIALVIFVAGLKTGHSFRGGRETKEEFS